MRLRVLTATAGVVAIAVVVAACGVPKSGNFAAIDPNNIPPALIETTTTEAATTTTESPASTSTTAAVPSTTEAGQPVTLYFVSGQQVAPYDAVIAQPGTDPIAMLQALARGPSGPVAIGLRTAIPADSQFQTSKERGVLTVEVNDAFLDSMAPQDQRLAIAQIVLTLTQLPGVGAVAFTNNGEPTSVFLWTGEPSAPGQKLNAEDFVNALPTSPPPTTSTAAPSPPEETTTTPPG